MECHAGYTKYEYELAVVGKRHSITEYRSDLNVRNQLWKIAVGDFVIDIGAGFGAYTLQALALAAGRVYAFERDPDVRKCLRNNLQSNRHLYAIEKTSVCNWSLNDTTFSVDRYLDELSFSSNRVDWIKIHLDSIADTRVVLWGCKETIKTYKPTILIADPEPPKLSFLGEYEVRNIIDGHSLLMDKNVAVA